MSSPSRHILSVAETHGGQLTHSLCTFLKYFVRYKELLQTRHDTVSDEMEVKRVMQAFSSNFFSRKSQLRKNFLAFDLDRSNSVNEKEFMQVTFT